MVVRIIGFLIIFLIPMTGHALECAHDAVLEEAAANILMSGTALESQVLRDAVIDAHGTMMTVYGLRVSLGDDATAQSWLQEIEQRIEGTLVCADAESENSRLILAAESIATLTLMDGNPKRVVASLHSNFTARYLVFQDSQGHFINKDASRALQSGEPLPSDDIIRVQLVAEGSRGPRPVAELIVDRVGDAQIQDRIRNRGDEEVWSRVARLRQEHESLPLRSNRLLNQVATRYADEVCRLGRVVHRSTTGDDPQERLRERGISARIVGETIARAGSRQEALIAFEQSSSHLNTLVDPRFTDGGFGMSTDSEGHQCVVVLLAAWPRPTVP